MASSKFSTVRQKERKTFSLTHSLIPHCFFKMLFSDYSAKNKNNNGDGSSGVLDKNATFLSYGHDEFIILLKNFVFLFFIIF